LKAAINLLYRTQNEGKILPDFGAAVKRVTQISAFELRAPEARRSLPDSPGRRFVGMIELVLMDFISGEIVSGYARAQRACQST
jgi:hypothetical protein